MQNKRLNWVDAAKGIGIFLVFLGHTTIPDHLFKFVFSFHMPLFFFLSGLLYREAKFSNWQEVVKSKYKKLILPYFLFFGILLVYWLLVGQAIGDIQNRTISVWQILYEFFYASAYLKTPFAPLWFLLALFWAEILFFIFQKNIPNRAWLFVALLTTALASYFYSLNFAIRPPWGLDIALVAVLLYGLGFYFGKIRAHFSRLFNYLMIPILILAGALDWLVMSLNGRVDMMANEYGNFGLFLVAALAGITMIILLAKLWPARVWQYLGRNSLALFALQFAALDIGKTIVRFFWPSLEIDRFGGQNIILGLGLTIFALALLSLILKLYEEIKKRLSVTKSQIS